MNGEKLENVWADVDEDLNFPANNCMVDLAILAGISKLGYICTINK